MSSLSVLGCEAGGRALVEVLPVVLFSEKGEQQVMALRDLGCNRAIMDELDWPSHLVLKLRR